MSKPVAQVIGLKTLDVRVEQVAMGTPIRPYKKRVFTDDEWAFLNTLPTDDLWRRIRQGDFLTKLLESPQMLNMTPKLAAAVASNLKFQMEAIRRIIDGRSEQSSKIDIENKRDG